MQNEQRKMPEERVYELYGEQEVTLNMNVSNLNKTDKDIIFTQLLKDKTYFSNFKFKELEKRMRNLMDIVRGNSVKPYILNCHIKKGTEENIVPVDCSFVYYQYYLSPLLFPYLMKQNSISLKANYSMLLSNRLKKDKNNYLKEDEMSVAGEYSQKNSKVSYYISNLMFFKNDWELETKFKSSRSERDIKRKQTSGVFKSTLTKSFNHRPFIFRENYNFDKTSKLNFQYAHKIINNYVDEFNCSSELISKLPQEDSQHHIKLSYLRNFANLESKDLSYFKIGTSLIHSLNSTFIKNKIFYRKFFITNPLIYQINLELGNVQNLKGSNNELRIHERLFIDNFRGIVNPSRKVIVEEGKIIYLCLGKTGDSIGNTNYLMIANKILFSNIPIFNTFLLSDHGLQVFPFIHFNMLWTPELFGKNKNDDNSDSLPQSNIATDISKSNAQYNPLHVSAGFGISLITQVIAIELYYNAYVKKNGHDVGKEFSIKFGLD